LLIVAREDDANLHVRDIAAFFRHYSNESIGREIYTSRPVRRSTRWTIRLVAERGSKVVMAAAGPKRRELQPKHPRTCPTASPTRASSCPASWPWNTGSTAWFDADHFSVGTIVDDSDFCARHLNNWLW